MYVQRVLLPLFSGVPAWRLIEVYSVTVDFSPILYCTVDPMLLPWGSPMKFQEFLSLQPMFLPISMYWHFFSLNGVDAQNHQGL